jgi:tetratricopeptide (TPR) repeat protein
MLIWAQIEQFDVERLPVEPFGPTSWLFGLVMWVVWFVGTAFWIWMLIECLRNDPDRYFWIWILIIIPFGSPIYFFVRWLPSHQLRLPGPLRRLAGRRELVKFETAARQIGNPHQYIQWGDALKDARMMDQADDAYREALNKEPDNIQALWGSGQTLVSRSRFAEAKDRFTRVLELDPQYKFGDVSLELARSLTELGEHDAARRHLDEHVRRWRHPESVYMLALLEAERGQTDIAKEHLKAMIMDIDGSPRGIARRNNMWRSKARRMLNRLGSS